MADTRSAEIKGFIPGQGNIKLNWSSLICMCTLRVILISYFQHEFLSIPPRDIDRFPRDFPLGIGPGSDSHLQITANRPTV